jgi:hypothetical protein
MIAGRSDREKQVVASALASPVIFLLFTAGVHFSVHSALRLCFKGKTYEQFPDRESIFFKQQQLW